MTSDVSLDRMLHHLSECPPDFLAEPRVLDQGRVRVDAVVHDLVLEKCGVSPGLAELEPFLGGAEGQGDWLRLVLAACWMLYERGFAGGPQPARRILDFLQAPLQRLADVVPAEQAVNDPDRREELVRLGLQALSLPVPGETPAQSADRLTTLDSVRRAALIEETRRQQARVRELHEKIRSEKAREAAARVGSDW